MSQLKYSQALYRIQHGRTIDDPMYPCFEVLKELFSRKNFPNGYPFYQPVDAIQLNIPDYYDVIKFPMDMSTIRTKLDHGAYKTCEEFAEDFRLMFHNCYKYNASTDPITDMCTAMSDVFERNFTNFICAQQYRWRQRAAIIPIEKPCLSPELYSNSPVISIDGFYNLDYLRRKERHTPSIVKHFWKMKKEANEMKALCVSEVIINAREGIKYFYKKIFERNELNYGDYHWPLGDSFGLPWNRQIYNTLLEHKKNEEKRNGSNYNYTKPRIRRYRKRAPKLTMSPMKQTRKRGRKPKESVPPTPIVYDHDYLLENGYYGKKRNGFYKEYESDTDGDSDDDPPALMTYDEGRQLNHDITKLSGVELEVLCSILKEIECNYIVGDLTDVTVDLLNLKPITSRTMESFARSCIRKNFSNFRRFKSKRRK